MQFSLFTINPERGLSASEFFGKEKLPFLPCLPQLSQSSLLGNCTMAGGVRVPCK